MKKEGKLPALCCFLALLLIAGMAKTQVNDPTFENENSGEVKPSVEAMLESVLAMRQKGNHPRALEVLLAAEGHCRSQGQTETRSFASILSLIGEYRYRERRIDVALTSFQEAEKIRQRFRESDPLALAENLQNLGDCYRSRREYSEALARYEEALGIHSSLFEEPHHKIAATLTYVATCQNSLGRFEAALSTERRALDMFKAIFPVGHPAVLVASNNLAGHLSRVGKHQEALELNLEVLKGLTHQSEGKDSLPRVNSMMKVAANLEALGQVDDAFRQAGTSLSMARRLIKEDDPFLASIIKGMAYRTKSSGRHADALALFDEALDMQRRRHPLGDLSTADTLSEKGTLHGELGQIAEILSCSDEAYSIAKRIFKRPHPDLAGWINNLGFALDAVGQSAKALPHLVNAREMYQLLYPGDYPETAMALSNEAHCLHTLGRFDEALPKFKGASEMIQRLFPENHPAVARVIDNVGFCLMSLGRSGDALPLLRQALRLTQSVDGGDNQDLARYLNNTANALKAQGKVKKALELMSSSLEMYRRLFSYDHPELASVMLNLARLNLELGNYDRSASLFASSEGMRWRLLTRDFRAMTPLNKRRFEAKLQFRQRPVLWSMVFGDLINDGEMLLQSSMRRKQLLFEAARAEQAALRIAEAKANPGWRASWSQLQGLRREYNKLGQRRRGPELDLSGENRDALRNLGDKMDQLEEELRIGNDVYSEAAQLTDIRPADVHDAMRQDDALIDFLIYEPWKPLDGESGSRYGALVVLGDGDRVTTVDLGPTTVIDSLVRRYREHVDDVARRWNLVSPTRKDVEEEEQRFSTISKALWKKLWKPVEPLVGNVSRIYLGPEGLLNLVSFETIQQGRRDGIRYLLEDYELVYLGSSRDLARLALTSQRSGTNRTAVLVGDPQFDLLPRSSERVVKASSLGSVRRKDNWLPLPATGEFTTSVSDRLRSRGWDVLTMTGANASKKDVAAVERPGLFQIATHGDVLEKGHASEGENPLLWSRLVLAGANGKRSSELDCFLSAYEVAGMDFRGTEHVSLVACKTLLGSLDSEGVLSMRYAFLLAGARSVTASLWDVPAKETVRQIEDFYSAWLSREEETRYGAFRLAQSTALERARTEHGGGHPFYWAGIIYSGDPGDLIELKPN